MKEDRKFAYPDESISEDISDYYYDMVLKKLPKGKTILDVGCGRGTNVSKMAKFSKKAVGIDLSDERIKKAKRLYGHNKNVEFLVMDGNNLKFKPRTFDVVFSAGTMHHIPLKKTLDQFKKILKPGGIIYILDVYKGFYKKSARLYVLWQVLIRKGPIKTAKFFYNMFFSVINIGQGSSFYFFMTDTASIFHKKTPF